MKTFVWRLKHEKVEPLWSVVVILVVLATCGITTSLIYLEKAWEQALLSTVYFTLLVAASLNQGCIARNRITHNLDLASAFAIFLLNIYFWGKSLTWLEITYGVLLFGFFFGYGAFYERLTLEQYEILTNVWHVGIILLIFLVPARLKQNNLF